jgi:hypothetical protein
MAAKEKNDQIEDADFDATSQASEELEPAVIPENGVSPDTDLDPEYDPELLKYFHGVLVQQMYGPLNFSSMNMQLRCMFEEYRRTHLPGHPVDWYGLSQDHIPATGPRRRWFFGKRLQISEFPAGFEEIPLLFRYDSEFRLTGRKHFASILGLKGNVSVRVDSIDTHDSHLARQQMRWALVRSLYTFQARFASLIPLNSQTAHVHSLLKQVRVTNTFLVTCPDEPKVCCKTSLVSVPTTTDILLIGMQNLYFFEEDIQVQDPRKAREVVEAVQANYRCDGKGLLEVLMNTFVHAIYEDSKRTIIPGRMKLDEKVIVKYELASNV